MKINADWKTNKESLETLKRFKSRKEVKLNKTFLGRLFGKSWAIKPEQLTKRFKDFHGTEKFLIEDPLKYSSGEWNETGQREGYDKGIIVYSRSSPKYFQFTWIPYLTQAYRLFVPHEEGFHPREHKRERDLTKKIIETTDKDESKDLIKKGFFLITKKKVNVTELYAPSNLSPTDWEICEIEKDLFTFAKF